MSSETWKSIVDVVAVISGLVAVVGGLAAWVRTIRQRPELRVLAELFNPLGTGNAPMPTANEYTYVRLDIAVINKRNNTASEIIIKISSPPEVQTVAEHYRTRQTTTPGEGEYNMSTASIESDGYRTATHLVVAPPLQGNGLIAFSAGTAVVFAKNGSHVFRWSAYCREGGGRGTSGTFTVEVLSGAVVIR